MTKQEFRDLAESRILVLDGATGSNLLKRGMPYGVCTEQWVTEHPDVMAQLQKEYIENGSHIIYAPTFSGNRIKLKEYGLLDRIQELNTALAAISKEAANGQALVAGDITMTGAQLEPMGDLTFDELTDVYEEQIRYLVQAGVDLLVVETMMSLQETRAAVTAAKRVCDLPIMATLSFKETGRTLYGVSAQSAVAVLQGMGVDAVGINCSAGPDKMVDIIKTMKQYASVPVIAKPNAGMPKLGADGTTEYDMGAEEFKSHMEDILASGAGLIGGCCGTTPEFIGEIAKMAKGRQPGPVRKQSGVYLASEREVYAFEEGQVLRVGTKIDFSQNEELVEEYQEEIFDTVQDLAFEMEDEADIIRIAAKADGIEEKEALLAVAEEISRSVNLPCLIASDSLETIEYVVQHYSGIMAVELGHNQEEWKTKIKSIAETYAVPVLTIDKEIIYC